MSIEEIDNRLDSLKRESKELEGKKEDLLMKNAKSLLGKYLRWHKTSLIKIIKLNEFDEQFVDCLILDRGKIELDSLFVGYLADMEPSSKEDFDAEYNKVLEAIKQSYNE
jgi:hypothetical protein